jgi:hypothetical protein
VSPEETFDLKQPPKGLTPGWSWLFLGVGTAIYIALVLLTSQPSIGLVALLMLATSYTGIAFRIALQVQSRRSQDGHIKLLSIPTTLYALGTVTWILLGLYPGPNSVGVVVGMVIAAWNVGMSLVLTLRAPSKS